MKTPLPYLLLALPLLLAATWAGTASGQEPAAAPSPGQLDSGLAHVGEGFSPLLEVPEGRSFVLRQVWVSDLDDAERVELRIRTADGEEAGLLLQTLTLDWSEWQTVGFRLEPGTSLVSWSKGAYTLGWTGYWVRT